MPRERTPAKLALFRSLAVVGALAIVALAPAALASFLVRLSFDRQVVAADVFIIGVGVGDTGECGDRSSFAGGCTTVRVLQVLKGDVPSELLLSRTLMGIAETDVDCCEGGEVYAMALRRGAHAGVYDSTNGRFAIHRLETSWPKPITTAAQSRPPLDRAMSFDQQVVASDAFVIAMNTGNRHPCREGLPQSECTTFTLVRAMKGEPAAVFELPVSMNVYKLATRTSEEVPYGFDETGGVYAMALRGSGDDLNPLAPDAIHRLATP